MSLETSLTTRLKCVYNGSNDLGTPSFPLDFQNIITMNTGTGASQADKMFSDRRTIALSSNEDLDLAGVLTDPFGVTVTFAKVKAIIITAASGNTNNVKVKPATTNGFLGPFNAAADTVSIPPGGSFMVAAPVSGWTVTAGTGDLLNIANSGAGTSVTYDIVIIGTSA